MNITKEVLEIEETLQSKMNNLLLFLGIKTMVMNKITQKMMILMLK